MAKKRKRVAPPEVNSRVRVKYKEWEEGRVSRVEGDNFWVSYDAGEWPDAVPTVDDEGWSEHWELIPWNEPWAKEKPVVTNFVEMTKLTEVEALIILRDCDWDEGRAVERWQQVLAEETAAVAEEPAAAEEPAEKCASAAEKRAVVAEQPGEAEAEKRASAAEKRASAAEKRATAAEAAQRAAESAAQLSAQQAQQALDQVAEATRREEQKYDEDNFPGGFKCPLSLRMMIDPVLFSNMTGTSYERSYAERHIQTSGFELRDPLTRGLIHDQTLIPNRALQQAIEDYKVERDAWVASRR